MDSHKVYFWNADTGEVTYDPPEGSTPRGPALGAALDNASSEQPIIIQSSAAGEAAAAASSAAVAAGGPAHSAPAAEPAAGSSAEQPAAEATDQGASEAEEGELTPVASPEASAASPSEASQVAGQLQHHVDSLLGPLPHLVHLLFAARAASGALDTSQVGDTTALQAALPGLLQDARDWLARLAAQHQAQPTVQPEPAMPPGSPPAAAEEDMELDLEAEPPLPAGSSPPPLPSDPQLGPSQTPDTAASADLAAPLPGASEAAQPGAAQLPAAQPDVQPEPAPEVPKRPRAVLEAKPVYADPQTHARAISPPVCPALLIAMAAHCACWQLQCTWQHVKHAAPDEQRWCMTFSKQIPSCSPF